MKLFGKYWFMSDNDVIEAALLIMRRRFTGCREKYNEQAGIDYLRLLLCDRDVEVFCCIFMDASLKVISAEEMFFGTVASVKVHAREIVKRSIFLRASAVVVCHNHPNGSAEPSVEDIEYTNELKEGLKLMEIDLMDHVIVANHAAVSMKRKGSFKPF